MSRQPVRTTLLAMLLFAGWGCSSHMTMVAPRPPLDYEVLGHAEGSSSGVMIIGGTATNFIPLGLNTRTVSAYQDATAASPVPPA